MPEFTLPQPRATKLLMVTTKPATAPQRLLLSLPGGHILFVQGLLVAVIAGDVVYFADAPHASATRAKINNLAPALPLMRLQSNEFDFIIGTLLTGTGLQLTRVLPEAP